MRVALIAALALLATGPAQAHPTPRCFGAATRDPTHPCVNRTLAREVIPRPADAPLLPDAPCRPVARTRVLSVCAFGASATTPTIALLGDSHAAHFRATVDVAARAEHRAARSLTRPSCPFSLAVPDVTGQARARCVAWNRAVLGWLTAHPSIRTVIVSGYTQRPGVEDAGRFADKAGGIAAAWAALPGTVRRIVVLRDVPKTALDTMDCVERARERHEHAALACAVPRAVALQPDPAVAAAAAFSSRSVRVVDFTRFMCGPDRCYPVVGGALVHRDDQHLTAVFAATLGPYLLRALHGAW